MSTNATELPSALRAPVRNKPNTGDRHKCKLTVVIDGKEVDLTNESVARSLGLENGMIFTCEDEVVTAGGKKSICGKEYALHFPTKFQWKLRRKPADSDDTTNPAPATAESASAAPAQAQASGKKGK